MKFKKLAISLLLSACTLFSACQSKDNNTNTPVTGGVITESKRLNHYVEGTLHDVNVDFSAPVSDFAKNGKTDYKVVFGDSTDGKASGFIAQHIYQATGAFVETLNISEIDGVDENTQYIFVGNEDLFCQLGGEMPTYEKIGVSGYQIATFGKNVFINAYSENGYQMGAIAFLRETIGYDMLAEDCVVYEKDGKVMPAMDIVERPDFDYRKYNSTAVSPSEAYGMGYTESPFINTPESWVHNWYDFVSLEEADENPDWASIDDSRWQGCWTSRGNKDSYAKLINHLTEKVKGYLKANPNKSAIMIGQHDVGVYTPQIASCKCTSCRASYDYYGTMAGAWLSLCNRVSVKVDEWLQTQEAIDIFGGVKEYSLVALVYHDSLLPPIEKENGTYLYGEDGYGVPKKEMWFNNDGTMEEWETAWTDNEGNSLEDEVVKEWSDTHERIYSAPNIHFMFAASAADSTHSYYDDKNDSWRNLVDGWAGVGGEFYVWLYALNSRGTLYPFNSFSTTFETTRYFKTVTGKCMFWQTQYQNKNNAGFGKLRNYLNSKVEFDVNADYQFYVDKFFKYYYGVAGTYMQRYFDELQMQCRYIEQEYNISGVHANSKLLDAKNWPEGLMNSWVNLMSEAYDAVEQEYKLKDPDQYEVYKKHIMIEELFPLYVLCTDYASSYSESQLKTIRQKFMDNFYGLGNMYHWELGLMTEITDQWDLD